ncbi:MAG: hypothetical protein ACREO1_14665 [Arenimonas sp.]
MDKLRLAIYLSELAYIDYERRCADIWSEFIRVDPWLASEVKKLGYSEEGLAEWVCPDRFSCESSPAELVVEGKRDKVLAKIQRELGATL